MGGNIIPMLVRAGPGRGLRLRRQRRPGLDRARPRLLARRRDARQLLRRAHGPHLGPPGLQPLQPALADPHQHAARTRPRSSSSTSRAGSGQALNSLVSPGVIISGGMRPQLHPVARASGCTPAPTSAARCSWTASTSAGGPGWAGRSSTRTSCVARRHRRHRPRRRPRPRLHRHRRRGHRRRQGRARPRLSAPSAAVSRSAGRGRRGRPDRRARAGGQATSSATSTLPRVARLYGHTSWAAAMSSRPSSADEARERAGQGHRQPERLALHARGPPAR